MRFYLNQQDLGVAFRDFDIGTGLYPALSVHKGEAVKFIFDPAKFVHPPPAGYHPLQGDMKSESYYCINCVLRTVGNDEYSSRMNGLCCCLRPGLHCLGDPLGVQEDHVDSNCTFVLSELLLF